MSDLPDIHTKIDALIEHVAALVTREDLAALRAVMVDDLTEMRTAIMDRIDRVQDATTKQVMVANWHFNYEPAAGAATPATHAPIAPAPVPAATTPAQPAVTSSVTNAPVPVAPEPLEKTAPGTPLDAHPAITTAPAGQKPPD